MKSYPFSVVFAADKPFYVEFFDSEDWISEPLRFATEHDAKRFARAAVQEEGWVAARIYWGNDAQTDTLVWDSEEDSFQSD